MNTSSTVAAACGVLPPNSYPQHEITEALAGMYPPTQRALIERFHAACGVHTRHLVLPLEQYPRIGGFTQANDVFIRSALDLGGHAVSKALAQVGLGPE